MPAGLEGAESGRFEVLHKVEGIVIKWAHQIKSVLELKPEQALLDGKNPGPNDEIKFWADMAANLQCIYDQLSNGKVRKMAGLLKEKVKARINPSTHLTFSVAFGGKRKKVQIFCCSFSPVALFKATIN